MITILVLLSLTLWSTDAIEWHDEDLVKWAFNCDYNGNNIGNQKIRGEDCGGACLQRPDCTRFTWTNYEGGTCWLKNGNAAPFSTQNNGIGAVCGEVKSNRGGGGTGNIQWHDEDQVKWAFNCDYNGNNIGNQKIRGEDCGGACLQRQDCTRFTWTNYEGGTCWLKNGNAAPFSTQNNGVCGEVTTKRRSEPGRIEWHDEGLVKWAFNCDYNGGNIETQKIKGEQCGGACLQRQGCSRFTWTNYEGGTCWLKNGNAAPFYTHNGGSTAVCGYVKTGHGSSGIKWHDEGEIQWAFNCDYNGGDIGSEKIHGEDCGEACQKRQDCTRFRWTSHEGGTCWLKNGYDAPFYTQNGGVGAICGKVDRDDSKVEECVPDDYYDD